VKLISYVFFLDGEDVTEEIRSSEVTQNTFHIANSVKVREIIVSWQRDFGQQHDIVMEGRDIGTVVFPEAQHKFYLDAHLEERTQRRKQEMLDQGLDVDQTQLKEDINERDQTDMNRDVSPLKKAEDAIVINSTDLSIDQVEAEILKHINQHG